MLQDPNAVVFCKSKKQPKLNVKRGELELKDTVFVKDSRKERKTGTSLLDMKAEAGVLEINEETIMN